MRSLYSIGIYILGFFLKLLAPFNKKIELGVKGRKQSFDLLRQQLKDDKPKMWFHCASLGEYEQGLPVFEALKQKYTEYQVVLTFFSPSGYEIKKDNSVGDIVIYLPLDTLRNAKRFIELVSPEIVVFTKYDVWPNYLLSLGLIDTKAYLISALFRPNQPYFQWYGSFMKNALKSFEHIFTQNEDSKKLLNAAGFKNVSISGDTRFDRVSTQLSMNNSVNFVEAFKQGDLLVVFGSSWPDDDKLFLPFINASSNEKVKYLIAPHNISEKYTSNLKNQIKKKTVAFSDLEATGSDSLKDFEVFILDTIGYLSKVYSYADIAYVGGAAGHTGLHNILEPAVFGIPILFGKNYGKFPEASDLIKINGADSISTTTQLSESLDTLLTKDELRMHKGQINANYIKKNAGSIDTIIDYLS
ncbi:3-deoxy-D-manno-octulosonic acid transferase [Winogradskyella aurantiaca]|uniref:3-deoxy-D-manno-octulosonic acid transferase n=1 Tax=Winogradskyella aurantiaca TaxID=2219558 RepID=UPI000E1D8998|nr:glycosyltransferase N-terminal domain-containing protein [Winogradskyella aurantiaca]